MKTSRSFAIEEAAINQSTVAIIDGELGSMDKMSETLKVSLVSIFISSPQNVSPESLNLNNGDHVISPYLDDAEKDYIDTCSILTSNSDLDCDHHPPSTEVIAGNSRGVSMKELARFNKLLKPHSVTDTLLDVYTCAMEKDGLWHGKLYIGDICISFHGKIFGKVMDLFVPYRTILNVEKKNSAAIFPNAIKITTDAKKHQFSSFLKRDAAYVDISNQWNKSKLQKTKEVEKDLRQSKNATKRLSDHSESSTSSAQKSDPISIKRAASSSQESSSKKAQKILTPLRAEAMFISEATSNDDLCSSAGSSSLHRLDRATLTGKDESVLSLHSLSQGSNLEKCSEYLDITRKPKPQVEIRASLPILVTEHIGRSRGDSTTTKTSTTEDFRPHSVAITGVEKLPVPDSLSRVSFICACGGVHLGKMITDVLIQDKKAIDIYNSLFQASQIYLDVLRVRGINDVVVGKLGSSGGLLNETTTRELKGVQSYILSPFPPFTTSWIETQRIVSEKKKESYTVECTMKTLDRHFFKNVALTIKYCITQENDTFSRLKIHARVEFTKRIYFKEQIEAITMDFAEKLAKDIESSFNSLQKPTEISIPKQEPNSVLYFASLLLDFLMLILKITLDSFQFATSVISCIPIIYAFSVFAFLITSYLLMLGTYPSSSIKQPHSLTYATVATDQVVTEYMRLLNYESSKKDLNERLKAFKLGEKDSRSEFQQEFRSFLTSQLYDIDLDLSCLDKVSSHVKSELVKINDDLGHIGTQINKQQE